MATTVMQDSDLLFQKAEDIIAAEFTPGAPCFQHMEEVVQNKIQTNVYDAYESPAAVPYQRRKKNGGLQDMNMVGRMHYGMFMGLFDFRHETLVVESGFGYKWLNSEMARNPFPRPFYEDADNELVADGFIDNQLDSALNAGL